MYNFGLIGYGYWGPNLARNIIANQRCNLKYIAELDSKRCQIAEKLFPNSKITQDYHLLLNDDSIEVVVISTPVSTHHNLVKDALNHGKNVLVTKPMTLNFEQCEELNELASKKNLLLAIDHTFLFSDSVIRIKDLIAANDIGKLYYYDSVRINLGLFQSDTNVLWDLAPHDISIMLFLLGSTPEAISAHGSCHFGNKFEDVVYLTAYYPNNLICHLHINWLSPVKIRKTIIGGSNKMIVWDDLDQENKLKVYNKGVDFTDVKNEGQKEVFYNALANYRIGDMYSPALSSTEPLKTEINHLINCLEGKNTLINNGQLGAEVVLICEKANESLNNQGKLVYI